jgi:hypothetical protein
MNRRSRATPAFDPRSRGAIDEKNMPAFNPPVKKHTFAERRDRGKACLRRLRRFATECGMNIVAMKKPGVFRRVFQSDDVEGRWCCSG